MAIKTMYDGINNSPITELTAAITATDTTLPIGNISALPSAPNIVTIGNDESAELVRYNSILGNQLIECERGFNGTTAHIWPKGTVLYRGYTEYDHDAFKHNISELDNSKLDKNGSADNTTVSFVAAIEKANILTGEKLSVIFGKISKWFSSFGDAAWKSVGADSNKVAAGLHASQHFTGGADAISPSDIGAISSINEKTPEDDGSLKLTAEDVGAVPTAGMVTLTDSYTLKTSDNGKIFYCNGGEGYAGNMYLYIASKPTQDMEFRILTDEYTTALVMPSDFEIDTGTWISTARHGSRAVFAGRTGRVTYSAFAETWVFENDSVWEDKLMQSCVKQYHLAESAVGTSELKDDAVTGEKIAPSAVGTDNIADKVVTPAKLDRAYATLNDADKVTPEQASASIVNKTASFTLSLADAGTWIYSSVTTAITITVPANTAVPIPIGTEIEFCQFNTGSVTFAAASGVTLVSLDNKKKIAGRYGCAALKKTATNTWILAGALS